MVILRHVKGGVRFGVEACTHIGPREIGSVYDKHITDKTCVEASRAEERNSWSFR